VGEPRPDGRVDVVVAGQSVELVARRLAGFGASVRVLDPPEARDELAAIGRELLA
jgi:predicted DNA-binding transcriptional regulator YafY